MISSISQKNLKYYIPSSSFGTGMDLMGKCFGEGGIRGFAFGVVLIRDWIPVISGKRNVLFLVGVSWSL